jgi:hypothetical protein
VTHTDRPKDRHDEGNRRVSRVCQRARKASTPAGNENLLVATPTELLRFTLFAEETKPLKTLNKPRIQKGTIPWMSERVSRPVLTHAVYLTFLEMDGFLFCKRVQTYANGNILLATELR